MDVSWQGRRAAFDGLPTVSVQKTWLLPVTGMLRRYETTVDRFMSVVQLVIHVRGRRNLYLGKHKTVLEKIKMLNSSNCFCAQKERR
ncbi:hypothetical protein WN55_01814 [Dufourea novaeangliae]|uniref:Uncharacterized protein n=1 Tax=Dufourea novaeangliae TaxID=178035 RepID=A0A154PDZ0_DUFNO|nr:hypothetical protein WN55_01814 [Dufourea novaeangliae]